MGRPSQDCFGSEEEVKPNKITHFEVEQTSFHDHSMLNGNRAQMGCQLAMTSGFTNLFIGRQRINRQFEPLQSGASQIGNTFTNLGAVAQNCQTPISLDPAKRLANWLCRFWMTCQVNSLWSEGHSTNELSPISFSIKKLTKFLQGRPNGRDRGSPQHNPQFL